jgi:Domain of unknown function (DUF4249)
MIKRLEFIVICAFGLLLGGCIEPYNPPEVQTSEHYLVVDGLVDSGDGSAEVMLTYTQSLDSEGPAPTESGANVSIEINGSQIIQLSEVSGGIYVADNMIINEGDKCRLLIKTANGIEFASEVVTSKSTPAIDSVTWEAKDKEFDIDVTAHDATDNTRFYRWKYEETAWYRSTFYSTFIWDPTLGDVRVRKDDEEIFDCWKTIPSTIINVFSTEGLASDQVNKYVLIRLPTDSWKLKLKYSVLVHQYAIDQNEYNFWNQLKKNTESIGSIFDPQPTQLTGNISSVNSSKDKVLGYFSVSTAKEERIFVDGDSLPYTQFDTGYGRCYYFAMDTLLLPEYYRSSKRALLIAAVYDELGIRVIGYTTASDYCIDCKIAHEGTTIKPDFWP